MPGKPRSKNLNLRPQLVTRGTMNIRILGSQALSLKPTAGDLPALLKDASDDLERFIWVDLRGPGHEEVKVMREVFQFHPLAVEDTLNEYQRPKVESYDDYVFVIMNPVSVDTLHHPVFRELDIFVGTHYVVTVHSAAELLMDEVQRRLERATSTGVHVTPSYLLYTLVDTVVDSYFPVLDQLEADIERLEETIPRHPTSAGLENIFLHKRALTEIWRVLIPQRDLVTALSSRHFRCVDQNQLQYYLRDVADHLAFASDMVSVFRETLHSLTDLYMSAVSNRVNFVVNRLTVLTLVIGVLTVISGFYGMNFERTWPPFGVEWGVPFVLLLMLSITVGLVWYLRRRDMLN